MSRFQNTLKTEQLGKWNRVLLDNLTYVDDELGAITVPGGFVTDFASVKALHNVFLFVLYALVAGYGNYASTVHDWLYVQATYPRAQCDQVLYRALRAEGVAKWRAALFWAGVRLGGRRHYQG
ncbi:MULTISPECIES: DUF1353 domain-containing protein [unclassified Pseudomonas]|uniref:DUF1353 domain-containing protein n=1 Tax=unclassified Pseudomonas TaxID=196821 RepID=UPI00119E6197|nr:MULTISPECIES: DUF1353 domain-containing protein [unclassified Pseudomonas]TWC21120.1 uncharacterized protein DUF1353 [Pseudomonas sp. SJZ075]TWC36600.1 uncharacterized protein DUF1353 [Pseudomonas sp. SJZ078]TWC57359.1 uncharacterized protein DUF1353 [Pseudomonas sp. SJZ124]TWC92344.1 uncharacterized protein DUF1353 [Pseudomonas sp. SJZ101]